VKTHEAKCSTKRIVAARAAVLFTSLIKNLRLCSCAEAGLFLNFEQK